MSNEIFKKQDIEKFFLHAFSLMTVNCDKLVELDQKGGDGDLGISMKAGFDVLAHADSEASSSDCGKYLMQQAARLNEAAPSSLGTILSVFFFAAGKTVKGKSELGKDELSKLINAGIQAIMQRCKSKHGERTILDALIPGQIAIEEAKSLPEAITNAAFASARGAEMTADMLPVHGRAAYHANRLKGVPDGGAVVGQLLFEAMLYCLKNKTLNVKCD